MISKFFIERPIFANVIAIVTIILGMVCFYLLPVAQYPPIVPPTIQVSTRYPGASAEVVAATVGVPIEQAVNGVEGSIYMSSTSASDGSYTLTITFNVGTNLNTSVALVQNLVASAMPQLPARCPAPGSHGQEGLHRYPAGGQPLFGRQTNLTRLFSPITGSSICKTPWPACPASARSGSSAPALTACGSGWIPTNSMTTV